MGKEFCNANAKGSSDVTVVYLPRVTIPRSSRDADGKGSSTIIERKDVIPIIGGKGNAQTERNGKGNSSRFERKDVIPIFDRKGKGACDVTTVYYPRRPGPGPRTTNASAAKRILTHYGQCRTELPFAGAVPDTKTHQ